MTRQQQQRANTGEMRRGLVPVFVAAVLLATLSLCIARADVATASSLGTVLLNEPLFFSLFSVRDWVWRSLVRDRLLVLRGIQRLRGDRPSLTLPVPSPLLPSCGLVSIRSPPIYLVCGGGSAMAAGGAGQCPEIPRRCHHCAGPLSKDMIGSAVGGTAGAFYGFNHVMPVVRRYIKGPMWIHFLVGAPPVIVFSSACAGLAVLAFFLSVGGTIPAAAQLVSSSYHAAMSSPSFNRSASPATMPSPAFGHSASQDEMHKTRSSSPL
ncbi:hypothetical protein PR202_ga23940 [Eleusine coracana subsp. coracana]|uniref:Uncharacterized protein n=1 Tax=Eleusine coracana subsp. coracana TaxID=191504 RepID=A0AAV5D7V0_ELECO|nr:hypothetical protein PR202_ga23940 [Eleusine coracana subsp. coracana]